MALVSTTRGYIGKGKISIIPRTGDKTPVEIGNCKALSVSVDTDRKARIDYQNAGGGELESGRSQSRQRLVKRSQRIEIFLGQRA